MQRRGSRSSHPATTNDCDPTHSRALVGVRRTGTVDKQEAAMGVLQLDKGFSVRTFKAPPEGFDSMAYRAARWRSARLSNACVQSSRTSA